MNLPTSAEEAKTEISRLLAQPRELQGLLNHVGQQLGSQSLNRTLGSLPPEILTQARQIANSSTVVLQSRSARQLANDPTLRSIAKSTCSKKPSKGPLALVIYPTRKVKLMRITEDYIGTLIGTPVPSAIPLNETITAWFDAHHQGNNRRARRLLKRSVGGIVVLTSQKDLSMELLASMEE